MTTPIQPPAGETKREDFREAAQRELKAFVEKERDFQRRAKLEEALKLRLPLH